MENSILSLFDDDALHDKQQEKKAIAKKKTAKKSDMAANSMFSFDEQEQIMDEKADSVNVATEKSDVTLSPDESKAENTSIEQVQNDIVPTEVTANVDAISTMSTLPNINDEALQNAEHEALSNDMTATDTGIRTGAQDAIPKLPVNKEEPLSEIEKEHAIVKEIAPIEKCDNKKGEDADILQDQYLSALAETGYDIVNLHPVEEKVINKEAINLHADTHTSDQSKEMEWVHASIDEALHFDISPVQNDTVISSLPAWELTKQYYTIGEVAHLFEVNTSHIRFWSKEFKFKLRTNRKGDRHYTVDDINKLRVIYDLVKVKKHTIKGAREKLLFEKKNVIQGISLKEQLKDLQTTLIHLKNTLA
jgi:DNA-binding transcriptional MerR regulator